MNIPVNDLKNCHSITVTNSDIVGDALPAMINLVRQAGLPLGHITQWFHHDDGTVAITIIFSTNTKGELWLLMASLRCKIKFITLKKLLNEKTDQLH